MIKYLQQRFLGFRYKYLLKGVILKNCIIFKGEILKSTYGKDLQVLPCDLLGKSL